MNANLRHSVAGLMNDVTNEIFSLKSIAWIMNSNAFISNIRMTIELRIIS